MSVYRIFCLAAIMTLMGGCMIPSIATITGSGGTETRSFDLSGFTKLEVGSAFTVDVTQSGDYSVEVTVDDSLLDRLEVRASGDTLHIGLKSGTSIRGPVTMRAAVSMPELRGLDLSGATRGAVSGFRSDRGLSVSVSGASRLSGDITCGDARFDVSGASRVELTGAAAGLRVNASGASTVTLDDFPAADSDVEARGASRASVNVHGRLNATASGASTVHYGGKPSSVRQNTSGGSSVKGK